MKQGILKTSLIALALLLPISSFANDEEPRKPKQTKSVQKPKASAKKSNASTPAVALVDINSASKEELKKLPGIGDAEAERIIAGRPYLTKAHLQTHNIISPGLYQGVRTMIIARQKQNAPLPQPAKTQPAKK